MQRRSHRSARGVGASGAAPTSPAEPGTPDGRRPGGSPLPAPWTPEPTSPVWLTRTGTGARSDDRQVRTGMRYGRRAFRAGRISPRLPRVQAKAASAATVTIGARFLASP